jgi:hypothetical protein
MSRAKFERMNLDELYLVQKTLKDVIESKISESMIEKFLNSGNPCRAQVPKIAFSVNHVRFLYDSDEFRMDRSGIRKGSQKIDRLPLELSELERYLWEFIRSKL